MPQNELPYATIVFVLGYDDESDPDVTEQVSRFAWLMSRFVCDAVSFVVLDEIWMLK